LFRKGSNRAVPALPEIAFGPFRLRPTQFLLLEGDKPVRFGSRALEILVLLARPGELVGKEELMGRVWPNIFVEPANLTVHISALRRALRDGRDGNRFIINVPGRGYSFVASVEVRHEADAGADTTARRYPGDANDPIPPGVADHGPVVVIDASKPEIPPRSLCAMAKGYRLSDSLSVPPFRRAAGEIRCSRLEDSEMPISQIW
jgi:DNA-binding winged helix-turn-helix (wHTH) protein